MSKAKAVNPTKNTNTLGANMSTFKTYDEKSALIINDFMNFLNDNRLIPGLEYALYKEETGFDDSSLEGEGDHELLKGRITSVKPLPKHIYTIQVVKSEKTT